MAGDSRQRLGMVDDVGAAHDAPVVTDSAVEKTASDTTRTDPPPKHKNNNEPQAPDIGRENVAAGGASSEASAGADKSTSRSTHAAGEQLDDARETEIQRRALEQAQLVADRLRAAGWHFVAISLSRHVCLGTRCSTPGSAIFSAHLKAAGPSLPNEARSLRALADVVDREFAKLNVAEADSAYVKEIGVLPSAPAPSHRGGLS